jgi:hypothetical protein
MFMYVTAIGALRITSKNRYRTLDSQDNKSNNITPTKLELSESSQI